MNDKILLISLVLAYFFLSLSLIIRGRRDRKISAKYLRKKINDLKNLDHVIVLKKGGLKLFSQSFCSQEIVTELYSGLFEAISSVGEMIGTGEKLRRISYENYQIVMCEGKYVKGVCVLRDVPQSSFLTDALTVFIKKFEGRYGGTLMDWSGKLDIFSSAFELLDESFSTYLIYPVSLLWDGNEENLSKLELNTLKMARELGKETSLYTIPTLVELIRKTIKKPELKILKLINDLVERGYFLPTTCV